MTDFRAACSARFRASSGSGCFGCFLLAEATSLMESLTTAGTYAQYAVVSESGFFTGILFCFSFLVPGARYLVTNPQKTI